MSRDQGQDRGQDQDADEGQDAGQGQDGGQGRQRCSLLAAAAGEPPEGTAPEARVWLAVAHPGPWGRQATDVLPTELRAAAEAVPGLRLAVVRPVGGGPGPLAGGAAAVLAGTLPGRVWRRDLDEAALAALPRLLGEPRAAQALAHGEEPRAGRASAAPLVLVCTHGRRDACCAQYGRAAARAVVAAVRQELGGSLRRHRGVDVVESSHLGGHRLAPTAAVLPWGMVFGGLGSQPEPLAAAVVDLLADRTVLDGYRGRSSYPAAAQAAEAAVRRHLAIAGVSAGPDDVVVDGIEEPAGGDVEPAGGDVGSGHGRLVRLRHTGGRTFRVAVERVRTEVRRPASCGAEPAELWIWEATVDADSAPGIYLPAL